MRQSIKRWGVVWAGIAIAGMAGGIAHLNYRRDGSGDD